MPTNAFSYGCQLIFVDRGRYPRCYCPLCVCTHNMRDPFGFLFQASMLVVLLCRSLIKILKVNQFVCLLPRGLSPFTPHFSKILKKVQFRDLHLIDAKHLKCSVCWLKKVLKYFKKVSHDFSFLELSESFWYLSPMPSYNML